MGEAVPRELSTDGQLHALEISLIGMYLEFDPLQSPSDKECNHWNWYLTIYTGAGSRHVNIKPGKVKVKALREVTALSYPPWIELEKSQIGQWILCILYACKDDSHMCFTTCYCTSFYPGIWSLNGTETDRFVYPEHRWRKLKLEILQCRTQT